MLGNIKEFISVVQDGLSSNNNLRQTLQEVQKVKYIFKEKQKHAQEHETKVNFGAGGRLLEKYQQDWAELHENAVTSAVLADETDKVIRNIHGDVSLRLVHARDFCQSLANLPKLTAAIEECIDSLNNIQFLLKTVENELAELEDITDQSNMAKWKLDHHYHLSVYKEKKLVALEEIRGKLAKENADRTCKREKQQLAELQMRHNVSASAFQNDMANYLATGIVPKPIVQSTPEVSLEQIQLDDNTADLNKFLES
ncbi:Dysbindin protein homolog [Eumeta japonica]|uniref:Dysbindin domain-containing protein 1 n=1 Tax=Eumeta variegata TaxID=151549 RepID=A0A4C1WFA2_EUMVA|nr:Dysbindin protein homolog [Eumeta japonica]